MGIVPPHQPPRTPSHKENTMRTFTEGQTLIEAIKPLTEEA